VAVATVTDFGGNSASATVHLGVRDPGDVTAPVAEILSPADDDVITAPTNIAGTVTDENFVGWALAIAKGERASFTTIAEGSNEVTENTIGQLDPTLLENGIYRVRLRAIDVNGLSSETVRTISIEGGMKIGIFTLSFTDLVIPLSGIPITVTRTYDSRVKTQGDFGIGWKLDVSAGTYEHNRKPGEAWSFNAQPSDPSDLFFIPCISENGETASHRTEVRLSEREFYTFALTLNNINRIGHGCVAEAQFEQIGGWGPQADLYIQGNNYVVYEFGTDDAVRDETTFEIFNPRFVQLHTYDGRIVDFDRENGITGLEDRNGNSISISDDGIVHSSGNSITKSVEFERDLFGRISAVNAPMDQRVEYEYDQAGDLVLFTDQALNATSFTYDDRHNLEDIINARGVRAVRSEYDEHGRLIAMIDPLGRRIEMEHDLVARVETTLDRLGNETIHYYDERGNVTQKIDALNQEWNYTYDADDNELTIEDPLGRISTRTYDANNNVLTVTSFEGDTTTLTRDVRGQVLTTEDSRERLIINEYDAFGNLVARTDGEDAIVSYEYDASGNLTKATDPLLKDTAFTYDTEGNQVTMTDTLGHLSTTTYDDMNRRTSMARSRTLPNSTQETITTSYGYDALGKPTTTTDPYGKVTTIAYDEIGKVSSVIAKNGSVTQYHSNQLGLLENIEYVDGTNVEYVYDAEGRTVSETDRGQVTTTYTYDGLGRRTRETHSDGSYTQTTFDGAGRILTKRDPRGYVTSCRYPSHHVELVTDALTRTTTIVNNADHQPEEITDALGRTTELTYDRASLHHGEGRLVRTDFEGGSYTTVSYDSAGRKVAETDQNSKTTLFGYDDLGRLTSVTDALEHTWTYGYDEVGNRISITDPKSRITRFQYDRMGRMTRRTLPLGQYETMAYDDMGNMISKTDFNGHTSTFVFDAQSRMTSRTFYGQATEYFTYGPRGERLTADNESFTYDDDLRLTSNTKATGEVLSYTYDAAGNRTAIIGPHGVTSYAFDALNRVSTVTDPGTGVYTYSYDLVGNQTALLLPNGVITTRSYNPLNHLTRIESRNASNVLLAAYAYEPDATGRQQNVEEEHSGRVVVWGYDDVYRLTSEDITDSVNGDRLLVYEYDEVGNRETKTDSDLGLIEYEYDDNDRLTTETSEIGGATTFGWDSNGNQITKSAGAWVYNYDARNLLRLATTGPHAYEYEYDVDGARIAKVVDGEVTNFMVDRNWENAQVLRETSVLGDETALHVFGREEILSQERAGDGVQYMLYDAQRSVRMLATASGAATDHSGFDAWGVALESSSSTVSAYRFSGERVDSELNLLYMRARFYDSGNGRFLSVDPLLGLVWQPVTLNQYLYAASDPTNLRDPSGLFFVGSALQMPLLSFASPATYGIQTTTFKSDTIGGSWSVTNTVLLSTALDSAMHAIRVLAANWASYYVSAFDHRNSVSALYRPVVERTWQRMAAFVNSKPQFEYRQNGEFACWQGKDAFVVRGGNIVYLCPDFFSGTLRWTNDAFQSHHAILLHEISHVAGTEDFTDSNCAQTLRTAGGGSITGGFKCYGEVAVNHLARNRPSAAAYNADNYVLAAHQSGVLR
jgi:RHS repeat-associated protein